jgi:hypothetical protein
MVKPKFSVEEQNEIKRIKKEEGSDPQNRNPSPVPQEIRRRSREEFQIRRREQQD